MGKYEDLRAMREAKARDLKHPQHPELGPRVIHPDQERDLTKAVEKIVPAPLNIVPAPANIVPASKKKRGRPLKPDAARRDMAAYKRAWRAKQKKAKTASQRKR